MPFEQIFEQVAGQYDLDPLILAEQAAVESRLNPAAVGSAKAMGLMQLLPATWDEWAPKAGVSDPFSPESNLRVAAAYLAWIRQQLTEVDRPEAYWMLTAYKWGIGNVLRLIQEGGSWEQVPSERQSYATDIILSADARGIAEHIDRSG